MGIDHSNPYIHSTTVLCDIRVTFVKKLRELLGDRYVNFDKLNSIEKTAYVLGSELWDTILMIYSA